MPDTAHLQIKVESSQVSTADKRLKKLNRTSGQTERATSGMTSKFTALTRSGILPMVGAVGALTTAFITARKAIGATAEYETLRAQLKTATGSVEEASAAFERLQNFAQTTPFIMNEVVESFVKLRNLGLNPSIDTLTSYGNTASAMGKSLNQFIEAVADASVGEFERLKEFGIKARKNGEEVTFVFRGARETVQMESSAIEAYLKRLGDVEFAGAMDEQSNNLSVSFSNLEAATDRLFVAFAEESGLVGVVKSATNALSDLFNLLAGAPRPAGELTQKIVELEAKLETASGRTVPALRRELKELREELARTFEVQEGASGFKAELADIESKIKQAQERIASAGTKSSGRAAGRRKGATTVSVNVEAEQENLNALLEARERLSQQIVQLEEQENTEREQRAAEAAQRAEQRATEAANKKATKEKEASAKAFERLQVQLLSEEEALRHTYEQRLELIRENTEEGSELRKELEEKALEDLEESLQLERDVYAQSEDQKAEVLREKYDAQQEILRVALDARLISEQEFQERSKANWARYQSELDGLQETTAISMRASQLSMYGDVLSMAGKITGQLSDLVGESNDAAKAMFVAQKAIAIAQAIVYTELAATRALAEGGMILGIPMSTMIRALGYTSVGLMAAQSVMEFGQKFEHGGMIPSGQYGIVGEAGAEIVRGPAMVTSARTTAGMRSMDNPSGGVNIVVNNNAGVEVAVSESEDASGLKTIEILMERTRRELVADIQGGSGPVAKSLERVYALNRGNQA